MRSWLGVHEVDEEQASVVDPKLIFQIRVPFSSDFWIRILLD
jgi:hypothetical protein